MRAGGYQPRSSEGSVLHGLVRHHLETFLQAAIARGEGTGLPDFVEREFRDFLGCGVLARGFARVRCGDCAFERLVPFSCKGRGFCPSCGGRRMAAQASHLVDAVLPRVAVRQWVLSLRKYRSGGRENRLSLGVYPDVSLKAARAKRDAARQQLAAGIDPGQARKAEKLAQAGAECFEAIAREWHAKFSRDGLRVTATAFCGGDASVCTDLNPDPPNCEVCSNGRDDDLDGDTDCDDSECRDTAFCRQDNAEAPTSIVEDAASEADVTP